MPSKVWMLLSECKILIDWCRWNHHWTVLVECGGVVWSWNLLGCVLPSQCQHPGTHQSLGWTSLRPQPAGCLFHERSGRPRLQSGWVQLLCGSDQSGPPGMSYCREEASKTRHTSIRPYCSTQNIKNPSQIKIPCSVMGWWWYRCFCVNKHTLNVKWKPEQDSQCPPAASCWPLQYSLGPCQHPSGLAGNSHNYSGSETLLWPPATQDNALSGLPLVNLTMRYTI